MDVETIVSKKRKFNDTHECIQLQSILKPYFISDINSIIIEYYKTLYIYQLTNNSDHDNGHFFTKCIVISISEQVAKYIHPLGYIYNLNNSKWYCNKNCDTGNFQFDTCTHDKTIYHVCGGKNCWIQNPCRGNHNNIWSNNIKDIQVVKIGEVTNYSGDFIEGQIIGQSLSNYDHYDIFFT